MRRSVIPKNPCSVVGRCDWPLLQGISVLVVLVIVFAIAYGNGNSEFDARALAFTTLIISNLAMILTNRSWFRTIPEMLQAPNQALWWVIRRWTNLFGISSLCSPATTPVQLFTSTY
ncbi:MAG UNVERIFIED_CONTAM: hypothetical protein LVR29_11445 [Microcystis novacekii LVE1205-3]